MQRGENIDSTPGWDGPADQIELCHDLAHSAHTVAGDPDRSDLHREFCREVIELNPSTRVPLHRLLHLVEVAGLFVLRRTDEVDESTLEANPTDTRIYVEWGDRHLWDCLPAGIPLTGSALPTFIFEVVYRRRTEQFSHRIVRTVLDGTNQPKTEGSGSGGSW